VAFDPADALGVAASHPFAGLFERHAEEHVALGIRQIEDFAKHLGVDHGKPPLRVAIKWGSRQRWAELPAPLPALPRDPAI
jgi:hypothetical protein